MFLLKKFAIADLKEQESNMKRMKFTAEQQEKNDKNKLLIVTCNFHAIVKLHVYACTCTYICSDEAVSIYMLYMLYNRLSHCIHAL